MFRRTVGDDIELRQFAPADAPAILAAVDRNREYLREWLPWVDGTRLPADILQFISRVSAQYQAGLGPNAGIWQAEAYIGAIGCHEYDQANRSCSMGYWIDAGQQGKGTVTRCSVNLLEYLFEEAGLHRVEIRCGTGNIRSRAIPQRLGFSQEGLLREAQWVNGRWLDLEVWSLLRQNWRPPR